MLYIIINWKLIRRTSFKDKFKPFQNLVANDNIILRQPNVETDLEVNLRMSMNPNIWKYYDGRSPGNKKESEESIKNGVIKSLSNQIRFTENGTMYVWTIADKNTNEVLGGIHLSDFEANNKIANIGYYLDEKYWNKGIITACIKPDFGFSHLELERIYSKIHIDNFGSWKALENNGFIREGLLKHCFVCPMGLSDCYIYARVQYEF